MATPHEKLEAETLRRRTFAIISHPDAGKTTLTEKLLLYGGAIHLAGAVKAKKNQRHTTSDWMELEKQRGISISSTVLQFEYNGTVVNLLDTPGHKDFSEDTYRTLMAADAAVMLIDAAKGVEPQTKKLFEVCRMRGLPIFTFINKMDRPSREPLDLLDELEKVLGIRSCPITWPIGSGDRFRGVYERSTGAIHFFQTEGEANVKGKIKPITLNAGKSDPEFEAFLAGPRKNTSDAEELKAQFETEMELLEVAGDAYDLDRILEGELTPVFFGSAMNNFGIENFLQRFIEIAPRPTPRVAKGTAIAPTSPQFSAFVFKIQANMDPNHRDRVAFFRICSGHFERGMEVKNPRVDKPIKLLRPLTFFGQDRELIDEAWPGDIIGIVDTTSGLRIGDTLCTGKVFEYDRIPSFLPEFFASILILDPMKRKQLKKGLDQLAEEGVVQVYSQLGLGDKDPILGAVGALQLEVLKWRLELEYRVESKIEPLPYQHARWITGEKLDPTHFERQDSKVVVDRDGHHVVLFKSEWAMRYAIEKAPAGIHFLTTAPQ